MKNKPTRPAVIDWYEQRPLRMRLLLLVCVLAGIFSLWNLLVLQPLQQQRQRLQTETSQIRTGLADLERREQQALARKDFDPDREIRQQLAILQSALQSVQARLAENVVNLVSPQEMPELLKELLLKQQRLQLLSLENLPAEEVLIDETAAVKTPLAGLYRHRLQMEFSGDYLSTLNYLRLLEQLPRHLVWDRLEIETLDYPRAKVRFDVFTLSLSEGWIGG